MITFCYTSTTGKRIREDLDQLKVIFSAEIADSGLLFVGGGVFEALFLTA